MPHKYPEMRRKFGRERHRRRTADRLAPGLCPRCGDSSRARAKHVRILP